MNQNFYEAVEDNPIIAAVKSMEDVEECCKHDDIRVIFILFGDVCSIGSIVKTIRMQVRSRWCIWISSVV